MKSTVPTTLAISFGLFFASVNVAPLLAQEAAPQTKPGAAPAAKPAGKPAKEAVEIRIGYLRAYAPQLALSVLDVPPRDEGVAGATVGDRRQQYDRQLPRPEIHARRDRGEARRRCDGDLRRDGRQGRPLRADRYFRAAACCRSPTSRATAGVLLFNVGTTDDSLREEDCRINVFHTAPTRTMLADGLAQYLDLEAMAEMGADLRLARARPAFRRRAAPRGRRGSAARSSPKRSSRTPARPGGPIRASCRSSGRCRSSPRTCRSMTWCWSPTRARCSGPIVPFRTWIPRPVAGTAGLIPSAWHPASEQWGGTQIQNRFEKATGRRMLSKDMAAWTAARIIGDAATRTQGADPAKIEAFIRADDFSDRRLQGPEADVPQMELAVAPADLPRRRPFGRIDVAPGRLPASGLRTGHAGRRPAGDQMRAEIS